MPSNLRTVVLALLLGASSTACRQEPETPVPQRAPQRLIEQLPRAAQREILATIDGVIKPILPPLSEEHRFVLSDPPPHPQLGFAIGLKPTTTPLRVRFEVLFEPPSGTAVPLYVKELAAPGWTEERIDLADRDLSGASLIFRRTVLGGPDYKPAIAWGNPILLPGTPHARPSLILVSLDTLRADFIAPYGRKTARTDALDRLAREGTLYEQAYSPSTWTLPSHTSLLYGKNLPESPAVMRNTKRITADTAIADRPLSTIMHSAGYLTAGFTGGGFLDWAFDFPRGFDTYFAYKQSADAECPAERFDGATVFAKAQQWLRANHHQPFFLFVHTYDAHDRCPFAVRHGHEFASGAWPELSAARNQELLEYYDRLIVDVDQLLASLLAAIDELGLRDSTLLIVTSDHGEAFSEHGARGHGCDMKPYEELSRVPLLLRFPSHVAAGARVPAPVSLIDVAPTALALLGLPPEPWMQGRLLPGLGLAGATGDDHPVFVHCGDALSVRRGRFKLITSHSARHPDELYDLADDPHERRSLPDQAAVRAQLGADAAQFWTDAVGLSTTPVAVPDQLDEGTKERLRALGYVK